MQKYKFWLKSSKRDFLKNLPNILDQLFIPSFILRTTVITPLGEGVKDHIVHVLF
jgi:hypothetical protein